MKIPQTPENWRKTLRKEQNKIFNLLNQKRILKTITEFNNQYIHWDKLRYKKIPKNTDAKHIWTLMKLFRSEKYYPLKFNGFNFKYTLLQSTLQKLHIFDKNSAGNLEIEEGSLSMRGRDRFIISSLMEEAIASSQLEGAVTTRKIAKEMLKQNRKPKSYDEKMIVNGYRTLKMIIEKKETKLTKKCLLEIQKSITKDTLKDPLDEGKFRDNNEVVVGDDIEIEKIYHTPPDYKKVDSLMDELCRFANEDSGDFIHPIIKGIILHFLIGYIHPFNDGNGRTARAIFYWYVISRGYWLFEYMAISKKILSSRINYGRAYLYTETDENDLTYFIEFNIKAIYEALLEMREYIKRKQREQKEAIKMVGSIKGINFRQATILKDLMESKNKIITIREIEETYNVVYQTARSDLLYMASLGYIDMKKIKNKFIFVFTEQNEEIIKKSIKR